ncbi:hypothetical protein Tco_0656662 [Tanacetum coccineum]|uniref:Uncharacterized protein n=1 Tax=Tanacetum coccineum TaxID=301880 RepID=A0ABQ4XA44_9ASTR
MSTSDSSFAISMDDEELMCLHQVKKLQPPDDASETTQQNDIWRLFTKDIMYLKRQCVHALEELDEMKKKQQPFA